MIHRFALPIRPNPHGPTNPPSKPLVRSAPGASRHPRRPRVFSQTLLSLRERQASGACAGSENVKPDKTPLEAQEEEHLDLADPNTWPVQTPVFLYNSTILPISRQELPVLEEHQEFVEESPS